MKNGLGMLISPNYDFLVKIFISDIGPNFLTFENFLTRFEESDEALSDPNAGAVKYFV